jgi:ubiquinone/menaquinone biosynthesis C-methylase UbiE
MKHKGQAKVNDAHTYHQPGVLRVDETSEQTKSFYNKIAGIYDALSNRSEEPLRKAGLEMLHPGPGEQILEIGFGTGRSLVEIAKAMGPNGKAYGIDLSEKMLEIAQKRARRENVENIIELSCGDARNLPYEEGSLDGIFMSFTLELFDTPDIVPVLHECKRVLKTDGRIVVVGMSRLCPERFRTRMFEWVHRHFPHFFDCRPIFVRQALEDAGFKIGEAKVKKMWANVEIVCGIKKTGSRKRSGEKLNE